MIDFKRTLALAILLTVGACDATHPASGVATVVSPSRALQAPSGAGAALDIGLADAVAPVDGRVGQTLRIHLPASRATGYQWELEGAPPSFLSMDVDPGGRSTDPLLPRVEGGAVHTWHFRALGPGNGTLRFAYRRPWEVTARADRRAEYNVRFR